MLILILLFVPAILHAEGFSAVKARKLGMQGIVFTDARQLESYFFSSAIAAL